MGGVTRGARDYFAPGEWNVVCSMCGRKRKSSEVVKNWQGLYRCVEHNEVRHPQDFVRATHDVQSVPFSQPPIDLAVPTFCDASQHSAIPGVAMPGCMQPSEDYIP